MLVTATEHYGSVLNRPFDFEKYLDDAARYKMTMTRTFLLFREQQSHATPRHRRSRSRRTTSLRFPDRSGKSTRWRADL